MGKLISVDGLDASGKKTQCNLLYNYLAVQNKNGLFPKRNSPCHSAAEAISGRPCGRCNRAPP